MKRSHSIPNALAWAKEPSVVSEPWVSDSREERQGQVTVFHLRASNSVAFYRASTKAEIRRHSLE